MKRGETTITRILTSKSTQLQQHQQHLILQPPHDPRFVIADVVARRGVVDAGSLSVSAGLYPPTLQLRANEDIFDHHR